ncbi:MAG: hypothetical protein IJS05_00535 [Paludibacteraceae bacterium]|nr:hypothetical protein [Paludibacteraceae bacterium]
MQINITIGNHIFAATLADNETGRAFAEMLPLTIEMNELNGNEKYHYLDTSLPTDSYKPGTINTGDLLLYGNNCIVLFYKTFSSSYFYTRIGKIDNPTGLADMVGSGNVNVRFEVPSQTTEIDYSTFDIEDKGELILHNGQVYVKHGDKTYTLTGINVK